MTRMYDSKSATRASTVPDMRFLTYIPFSGSQLILRLLSPTVMKRHHVGYVGYRKVNGRTIVPKLGQEPTNPVRVRRSQCF